MQVKKSLQICFFESDNLHLEQAHFQHNDFRAKNDRMVSSNGVFCTHKSFLQMQQQMELPIYLEKM